MQLHLQTISIALPCKPFVLSGQKTAGLDLHLYFDPSGELRCPECGRGAVVHAKSVSRRPLQAVAIAPYARTFWHVANRRGRCLQCDFTFTEDIPFRFCGRHVTVDLARKVCEDMDAPNANIRSTARRLGMGEDLARRVYDGYLRQALALEPEPADVRSVAVDEFSILKGHRYATLAIDLDHRRVLYTCLGRNEAAVAPFFSLYSKEFYGNIACVAMDQNHSYASHFSRHLPHVAIVSDRFHMSQNYTREVVDKVRLRIARQYRRDGDHEGYLLFKRANYRLLGSPRRGPSRAADERELDGQLLLRRLMGMNGDINTVVLMFEQLRALYLLADEARMRWQWLEWLSMAERSGIPELVDFAIRKHNFTDQVVAHASHQVTSAVIEGMMNKIKVIKRAAFGFRNFGHFFRRIRYTFLPDHIKQLAKQTLWTNSSQALLGPLDHAKCG